MALNKRGKEWEEYDNAVRWMVITVVLSVIVTIILALAAMPLGYLLGSGISKDTLNDVSRYFALVFERPSYLYSRYWSWFKQLFNYHGDFSFSLWIPLSLIHISEPTRH